ncbi:hypothetical protein IB233_03065 [Comamonas sp. CMM01]|uniref:hypothetical protein n=1 Tax=Comamonas TaxID=283 RepID=UPI00177C6393|nr:MULTISPECIES: hypothetical protein [Comamonas]MBD9530613.1 hypothetical protein [Comamonas sp. CMM01]
MSQEEGEKAMCNTRQPFQLDPLPGGAVAVFMESMSMAKLAELRTARQGRNRLQPLLTVCGAPTLPAVVARLSAEHAQVDAELGAMKVSEWESPRCKALVNREQELRTTLTVLRGLTQQPMQITEPAQ